MTCRFAASSLLFSGAVCNLKQGSVLYGVGVVRSLGVMPKQGEEFDLGLS